MHAVIHPLLPIRSLFYALLLIGGIALLQPDATAQPLPEPCVGGTQYYIAFPDTLRNLQDSRFPDDSPEDVGLLIYSSVDQTITISRSGVPPVELKLTADEMAEYTDPLMLASPIVSEANRVDAESVVSLSSYHPIVVYAYISTNFGTAGFTPLPVEAWGTEHYAASLPAEWVHDYRPDSTTFNFGPKIPAPVQILVIASEDDTEVTLEPTDSLTCAACSTFTLDRGEAYLVQSKVDTVWEDYDEDLAGTRIHSSKPVGVICSNTRAEYDLADNRVLTRNSVRDLTAEWIAPTVQHGREFIVTVTLDEFAQGHHRSDGPERISEGLAVFATFEDSTMYWTNDSMLYKEYIDISKPRGSRHGRVAVQAQSWRGAPLSTSKPAQAINWIASAQRFLGQRDSSDGSTGVHLTSLGSATAEAIPRKRWVSFAPFRAPIIREDIQHYVTVITDGVNRDDIWLTRGDEEPTQISFNQTVRYSDVVWAHIAIDTGVTYRLQGREGARFTGKLQGGFLGFESFTWDRADEGSTAPYKNGAYKEKIAGMYAMPLSGSTCPVRRAVPYLIETLEDRCDRRTLRISRADGEPLDIERLELDELGTENGVLEVLQPTAGLDALDTADVAVVRLRSLDPDSPGSGRLLLQSGEVGSDEVEIVVDFTNPTFELSLQSILLEEQSRPIDTTIILRNTLEEPVELTDLEIAFGNSGFSIVGTIPQSAWRDPTDARLVMPGDSLGIIIHFEPGLVEEAFDTLAINLPCSRLIIPMQGSAAPKRPCTSVEDIDFGVLDLNASRTEFFEICNRGEAPMTFEPNGPGGSLVYWEGKEFSISPADMGRLASTNLAPNQCVTIRVTFASQEVTGPFRTVARFYTNETSGDCRDSSVWRAQVGTVSVDEESGVRGDLTIISITPNPSSDLIRIAYSNLASAYLDVELIDATGRASSIDIERIDHGSSGALLLDISTLPSGLYYVRLRSEQGDVVRGVTVVR